MRFFVIGLLCIMAAGCAARRNMVLQDATRMSGLNDPIYLDSSKEHKVRLEKFLKIKALWTEKDKIRFLLESVSQSNATFIRNGKKVSGSVAARWLSWKMTRPHYKRFPIITAWDFVEHLADRSRKTGVFYEMILPENYRVKLRTVLRFELESLETALQERALQAARLEESTDFQQSLSETVALPVVLPPASL